MPVGTAGTVKAMTADAVRATGARHRPRQHLSPDAAARRRAGGEPRRAAPDDGLAGPDPDRFRRLPGDVAGRAAQDRRGRRHLPVAYRRQRASADAGNARSRSSACSTPPSPWRSTNARRFPRPRRRPAPRWSCRCAGPALSRDAFVAARRLRPVRHRPGQRLSRPARRLGRGADRDRLRRLRRSAASRSAKARRRCSQVLDATRAASAARTGRAI